MHRLCYAERIGFYQVFWVDTKNNWKNRILCILEFLRTSSQNLKSSFLPEWQFNRKVTEHSRKKSKKRFFALPGFRCEKSNLNSRFTFHWVVPPENSQNKLFFWYLCLASKILYNSVGAQYEFIGRVNSDRYLFLFSSVLLFLLKKEKKKRRSWSMSFTLRQRRLPLNIHWRYLIWFGNKLIKEY